MKSKMAWIIFVAVILGCSFITRIQAADNADPFKYNPDSTVSMQEMYQRRDTESKAYKDDILKNSQKTVALLTEIRDLLAKEAKSDQK